MNKTFIAIAVVCLALGGYFGYVLAPNADTQTFQAVGDTNTTLKQAQVVIDLSTTTPTTVGGACKLYNGDARDRIITGVTYELSALNSFSLNGTGLVNLTFLLGTSTGISTVVGNTVLNTSVATTTPDLYVASTTPGNTGSAFIRRWASGTCLNLFANGTSTAATGIFSVQYLQAQ